VLGFLLGRPVLFWPTAFLAACQPLSARLIAGRCYSGEPATRCRVASWNSH